MVGDLVAKIIDLESEITSLTNEYIEKRTEIIRTIDSVENSVLYEILFKRYVEGKSLNIIADEIGYAYPWTRQLHLSAIAEVQKIKGFDS